jgi:hypothetical protein
VKSDDVVPMHWDWAMVDLILADGRGGVIASVKYLLGIACGVLA